MKEQDRYKEILQHMIDQTNNNHIQTVDQLIKELTIELHKHVSSSSEKFAK